MTQIIESANEILQHFSGSASEREKLASFKVTLKDKKDVLKSIDETVLESTNEEDISKEIIEPSEIGESINRICVRINNALNPVNNVSSPSTDNSESVTSSNPINTSTPTVKTRLPKLTLRKFFLLLVPLIVSKLPEDMRLIVSRNLVKNEWKIDKLLCMFKLELEARERCNTLPECSPPKPFQSKGTRYGGR